MGTINELSTLTLTDNSVAPSSPLGGLWYAPVGVPAGTGDQSIPNNSSTLVQYPTLSYSNGGVTVSGTNNTTFTLTTPGIWLVTTSIAWYGYTGPNTGTQRFAAIGDPANSANNYYANAAATPANSSANTILNVTATVRFTSGTLAVGTWAWQNSGAALAIARDSAAQRMQIVRLGNA